MAPKTKNKEKLETKADWLRRNGPGDSPRTQSGTPGKEVIDIFQ